MAVPETSTLRCSWLGWLMPLLVACGGPVVRVDLQQRGAPQPASETPRALLVALTGKLGTQELARCHRTVREAWSRGISHVVFLLADAGSQGEDLGDLQSLFDRVQNTDVDTVAVLRGRVTQGAAALALCVRRVFCMADAQWGEVPVPDLQWSELLDADPEAAAGRRFDAWRELMMARLERRAQRLRPDAVRLALAMVDPRMQLFEATVRDGGVERQRILDRAELEALQAGGARVFAERPLSRPLLITAREAEEYGLSSGTLQGLDQLAEVLLIDRDSIGELPVNWAEHMVGWLELLQPFLLVAGFVLLLVELKTPGVGLPGLLGAVFLFLALFYSYLVGLAEFTEILVFFLGLAAVAVEIFLLPGTIVFGLVGFLCLVLALVLSRQSFVLPSNAVEEGILLTNLWNLTLLLLLVLLLGAVMWRLLPRVPWFNRVFLPPPGGGSAAPIVGSGLGLDQRALAELVGRTGRAATVLRPAGVAEFGNERIDVVTEGDFLDAGTLVRVLYVQGGRVVVAAAGDAGRSGERGSVGIVILLCVVGLALIVAEVLLVSFGIISVLAGVALLSAVFVAFQESTAFGVTMVIVEAVAAPIVLTLSFKLLPRTPFGRALILDGPPTPGSAGAADPSLADLVHKAGITLSPLRPAGFARIDGRKIDVVTRGEMLPADCPIVVLEVSGNRVIVGQTPP